MMLSRYFQKCHIFLTFLLAYFVWLGIAFILTIIVHFAMKGEIYISSILNTNRGDFPISVTGMRSNVGCMSRGMMGRDSCQLPPRPMHRLHAHMQKHAIGARNAQQRFPRI